MRATDSSPTGLLGLAHTILEAIERVPVALPELVLRLGISLVAPIKEGPRERLWGEPAPGTEAQSCKDRGGFLHVVS